MTLCGVKAQEKSPLARKTGQNILTVVTQDVMKEESQ